MTPQADPRPGPLNLLSDVAGLAVGNAEDPAARTGVTVVSLARPMTASVDVRGGGPGTRETDALAPENLVEQIHAVVLSGGSAFGLGAADAVAALLSADDVGLEIAAGHPKVAIVPAAILYDLHAGSRDWAGAPPYPDLARRAYRSATVHFSQGSVGAGRGAKAGTIKGGLGSASIDLGGGVIVAALVAANPVGTVLTPDGKSFWARPFEIDGEFGDVPNIPSAPATDPVPPGTKLVANPPPPGASTAIGVVATTAALTKAECRRMAIMAQDGYARAIRPAHTPFDGDTVFALSAGETEIGEGLPRAVALTRIGSAAADCVTRAVARGVHLAVSTKEDPPCHRDLLRTAG